MQGIVKGLVATLAALAYAAGCLIALFVVAVLARLLWAAYQTFVHALEYPP